MPSERYFGVITLKAGVGAFEYTQNLFIAIDANQIIAPPGPEVVPTPTYWREWVQWEVPYVTVMQYAFGAGAAIGSGVLLWELALYNYLKHNEIIIIQVPLFTPVPLKHTTLTLIQEHIFVVKASLSPHYEEAIIQTSDYRIAEALAKITESAVMLQHSYGATIIAQEESVVFGWLGQLGVEYAQHEEKAYVTIG